MPAEALHPENTTPETRLRLLVVTGMSGAGRSTAAHALEDLGWYVVDNLPPNMVDELCRQVEDAGVRRLAVVLDVRWATMFEQLPGMFAAVRERGLRPEVLFLDAADEVIVRRQSSARRPHPLQGAGRLVDGIATERRLLADLRATADVVIDTSRANPHQTASRVAHVFAAERADELRVLVLSFGFKNGLPTDADLVVDVRFLPNPHWVPELRPQTGLDQPVRDYVLAQEGIEEFIDQVHGLVLLMEPGYLREGKHHLTIGVGCTGGKHRSTAVATELGRRLRTADLLVEVMHRDLGLE
ncbi:RNase adapter RapZ [Desertihabitans aurantiacus]|uniref:RNase adapter RapZ n=1 Tax=Desertihabitans aurantiacus TaxID=2282477 RepID=UPI0022B7E317|nr:RNase adapter RapZ [Desertihabitans aurantiacus]